MFLSILPTLICVWTVSVLTGFPRAENTTLTGNEKDVPLRRGPVGGRGFFLPRPGSGSWPGAKISNDTDAIIIEFPDEDNTTVYPIIPRRFPINPPSACPKDRSCAGRCSSTRQFQNFSTAQKSLRCFCDRECHTVFHDCCADYERYCKKIWYHDGMEKNDLRWRCSKIKGKPFGVWMIATCAQDWSDEAIRLKCENSSSVLQESPTLMVDHSNNIFRNRYCAKCNNVEEFSCWTLAMKNATSHPMNKDPSLTETCSRISLNASSQFGVRFCYDVRTLCKNTHNKTTFLGCRHGNTALVSFMKETYKNYHCLKCNHRYSFGVIPAKVSCGPDFSGDPRFNFASMFTLPFLTRQDGRCSQGSLYDYTARTCRTLLTVSEMNSKVVNLPTKYAIQLQYAQNKTFNCFDKQTVTKRFKDVIVGRLASGFKQAFDRKVELNLRKTNWSLSDVVINVNTLDVTSVTFQILTIKIEINQTDLFSAVKRLNLYRLYFFYNPINASSLCCYTLNTQYLREMQCLDNQSNAAINMEKISIDGNGTLNLNDKSFKQGQYILYKNQSKTRLATCKKTMPTNCKYVLKDIFQWKMFANQSIYSEVTNSWFHLGEYSIIDGALWLCLTSEMSSTNSRNKNTVHETILSYSSLFCLSISILSLVVLLFIYSITSALRNLPGKNLMLLSSVLALAQLLWLFQEVAFKLHSICIALSVVLHFLYLASFSCSTSIALHSFLTFHAIANGKLSQSNEGKSFLQFVAFSLGFPFLWVIFFWLLDYNEVFLLGYGNIPDHCWLGDIEALYVSFFAPLFILLSLNFVLLLATVTMIQKCSKASQKLAMTAKGSANRSQIWIYIRMSSLMGFTWLFGVFQLLFPSVVVFEYFFVFVNGLQGLYIAVAFLCTDNVKKLLAKRIGIVTTRSNSK